MQNLYKYRMQLQSSLNYDDYYTDKVLRTFKGLIHMLGDKPLEESSVIYFPWEMPHRKPLVDIHYNILYIIAKHLRVKLMWRDLLPPDASIIHHGLWIIGENSRAQICADALHFFFKGYFGYEQWLKRECKIQSLIEGYNDVRGFASKRLEIHRDTTYIYLKQNLVMDYPAELKLENIIKEKFQLDYKKYRTDHKEYYHAISTKFHHKRMLL